MAKQRTNPKQPTGSGLERSGDRERVERVGRDEPNTASERERRRDQEPGAEEDTDLIESGDDRIVDERVLDDEMDEYERSDR